MESLENDSSIDQIYLSINHEAVEGAVGVSTNCIIGAIKTEEIIEICYIAGKYSKKLVVMDVCEFNPFVEDKRTGRIVASMFYYFAMGLSERL